MSAMRDEIVEFLNEHLKIDGFRDYSPNGMQVIGRPEVKRVALGVSANLDCFRLAAEQQANMLIVHHGLFWQNVPREIGAMMKARLKLLFDYDISLLGYHLPLDAHPKIGNNILWLNQLGFAQESNTLGLTNGKMIGYTGLATGRETLRALVEKVARISGGTPKVYKYGPETVRKLGVITGGGEGYLLEAISQGCDTYLTGEVGEPTESYAREEGINFIAAGHYNSEKIGIMALGDLVRETFKVETFFCDVPNAV